MLEDKNNSIEIEIISQNNHLSCILIAANKDYIPIFKSYYIYD